MKKYSLTKSFLTGITFSLFLVVPSAVGFAQDEGRPAASRITVRGSIVNATTGQPVTADLTLVKLTNEGMSVIQEIKNAGPAFAFPAMDAPDSPLMIRALYQNETFNLMIPPSGRAAAASYTVKVFETGAPLSQVQITSALQITKRKEGLHIVKYLAVQNSSVPPRIFDTKDLIFYLPADAADVRGQMQTSDSQMPIPVTIQKSEDGWILGKGFRPGESEMTVEFNLPSQEFSDRIYRMRGANAQSDPGHDFVIVIWQPRDAIPIISGGDSEKLTLRNNEEALRVIYGPDGANYSMSRGGYLSENPMESDENPIFDKNWKTIAAMGILIALFFLIISVLSHSGLRLVKPSSD